MDLASSGTPAAAVALPAEAAPLADADRVGLVDLLRGVALLGILLMNILGFALAPFSTEAFKTNPGTLDFWVRAANWIVFEGKMRALFGMVFGAGVWLFVERKALAGWKLHGLVGRRMGLLVLFGLLHAHLLLWGGDILYFYGVCGLIVFLLRNVRSRYLLMAVPIVALLDFTGGTFFYRDIRAKRLAYVEANQAEEAGRPLSPAQAQAVATWRELEKTFMPNREEGREITRKMRGGYTDVAGHVRPLAWKIETIYLPLSIPDSVALMLLGLALLRSGFLRGERPASSYRRVALVGYGLGLPLVTFAFLHNLQTAPTLEASLRYMERTPISWIDLIYPFQRILLVLGHVSALILLFKSGAAGWLVRRLQAVGQMAFSNYIAQTVICTLTFFGYGLGLYGHLAYWELHLFAAGVWVLQLAWSPWWLARFRFGPLEWLWRSLTYLRRQPMRRLEAAAT